MPQKQIKGKNKSNRSDLTAVAKDIAVSYEARVKMVRDVIEDTHATMDEFRERRERMAGQLKNILAKSESLRKTDFDRMMIGIVDAQNKREEEVRKMLENFKQEEEAVAERLRRVLAKGEEVRMRDFKKMLADIQKEQQERMKKTSFSVGDEVGKIQEEVHRMLDVFKSERLKMKEGWREAINLLGEQRKKEQEAKPEIGKDHIGAVNPLIGEMQIATASFGESNDAPKNYVGIKTAPNN